MKYRVIERNARGWNVMEFDLSEPCLISALEGLGYHFAEYNKNKMQRPELQGVPAFNGLAGPMWDGDAIRYENWPAYETLSY